MNIKKAKEQFYNHRNRARRHNIEFLLTFDEWLQIWISSGHYHEKGTKTGQYVMSRREDKGPYSVENVYIQTVGDNNREAFLHNNKDFIRPRNGEENHFYGKKHTEATKELCRQGAKNQIHSEETNKKTSETMAKKWQENFEEEFAKRLKTCEHCHQSLDPRIWGKYHGEYCKDNPNRKPFRTLTCEHCGKSCQPTNYYRWHGDKCKHKSAGPCLLLIP